MKIIGFIGPYCTANFGDWAMLINNMVDLGDNKYYVFTYSSRFPHKAVKNYFSSNGLERDVCFVEVKLTNRDYDNINPSVNDCISSIENVSEIEDTINSLDMLIVSGGDGLMIIGVVDGIIFIKL